MPEVTQGSVEPRAHIPVAPGIHVPGLLHSAKTSRSPRELEGNPLPSPLLQPGCCCCSVGAGSCVRHPVTSGRSGGICSQSRPVCAHFRVLCSQPAAEWEEVSTTSVPQLLSHSASWAHQRTEWDWFISYILLLPASKGAPCANPLKHFCCRTLFLLQGEGGGCRTLKCYRQGSAFWRGTCNLPLPAACIPLSQVCLPSPTAQGCLCLPVLLHQAL